MRIHQNDTECGGVLLTIVEVRESLQDTTVGVERLRLTDLTGRVPARVQDDLCVNKISGGYSLVQSLAESSSGRHGCSLFGEAPLFTGRIYGIETVGRSTHFGLTKSKATGIPWSSEQSAREKLGLDTSKSNSSGWSYVIGPDHRDRVLWLRDSTCRVWRSAWVRCCGRCRKHAHNDVGGGT